MFGYLSIRCDFTANQARANEHIIRTKIAQRLEDFTLELQSDWK